MRIISKFKDYYDGQMALGFDPLVTFIRNQETIIGLSPIYRDDKYNEVKFIPYFKQLIKQYKLTDNYVGDHSIYYREKLTGYISTEYIGFCGFIYPIYKVKEAYNHTNTVSTREVYYASTEEEFREIIANLDPKKYEDLIERLTKPATKRTKGFNSGKLEISKLDEFLIKNKTTPIEVGQDIFKSVGAPYFHLSVCSNSIDSVIVNPNLKELKFSKIMSAERCFQEISMFLATMKDKMELVEISDKDKITGHGFDKCSFRRCSNG